MSLQTGPGEPADRPANVYQAACPSRRVLELISDKWVLLLLPALHHAPMRNNELLRRIDGISQKMLTQTLRHLERNGLVTRRDFQEVPPHVEYAITPLGASLAEPLKQLDRWAETHFPAIEAAQARFDRG